MQAFRRSVFAATGACVLLLLAGAGSDQQALSDQVLVELEAANQARSSLAKERSDWESEAERLRLLSTTLQAEIEKLENQAINARLEASSINSSLLVLPELEQRLAGYEASAHSITKEIHEALDTLSVACAPGVIAERLPGTPETPLEGLQAALARLEQSENESQAIRVEIVSAYLDDQERSVKLLRVGANALWWAALDGSQQGVATIRNGVVWLEQREGSEIAQAIEIAEKRRQTEVATLPVDHLAFEEVKR